VQSELVLTGPFRLLRHQARRPPHAATKPGKPAPAIGPGTVSISPADIPTVVVPRAVTNASKVAKGGVAIVKIEVVKSIASTEPGLQVLMNPGLPELVSTVMDPKNFGLEVLS